MTEAHKELREATRIAEDAESGKGFKLGSLTCLYPFEHIQSMATFWRNTPLGCRIRNPSIKDLHKLSGEYL